MWVAQTDKIRFFIAKCTIMYEFYDIDPLTNRHTKFSHTCVQLCDQQGRTEKDNGIFSVVPPLNYPPKQTFNNLCYIGNKYWKYYVSYSTFEGMSQ